MLVLRRVRLINWHFFHDALVEFGDTTLLAGDNGSGKSTIIDAIQYALVADIRKIQFNAAATQNRTNRTLQSYCRCKIGATELDYYRGDTLTHVVLEFERDAEYFLAGIMVEVNVQNETRECPWLLEQGKIEDLDFFSGESAMLSYQKFREHVKSLGGIVCATKREYSSRLTTLLRVHRRNTDFNPYLEVLIRSVSFTPLTSVDRFVCDYILEERQVDISAMKENLINYKEAEREALTIEEKIGALEQIAVLQTNVDQFGLQITLQEYLRHRINLEINLLERAECTRRLAEEEREAARIEEHLDFSEKRRQRLTGLLDEAKLALASNDTYHLYERLNDQKQSVAFTLEKERKRAERHDMLAGQCAALLGRSLAPSFDDEKVRIETELDTCRRKKHELERSRDETRTVLADLTLEMKDIEKGILRFPESTNELRNALRGAGIEAWVFADRLEVANPLWQNAVEGWLNTQRFNILVEETNFQAALSIYDGLPRKIAGVGIPNLAKMRDSEIRPGSLAEIVEADSPLARRYAAHLLGDVMMATIDNLREYERAITKECMRYSGHTASRVKEEIYGRWYLGKRAKEKRLADLRIEIAAKEKALDTIESGLRAAQQLEKVLANVYDTLFELNELSSSFERIELLSKELAEIDAQLASIDTSEFEEIKKKIQNVGIELDEIRVENERLNRELGSTREKIGRTKEVALDLSESHRRFDDALAGFVAVRIELLGKFTGYYDERTKKDPSLSGLKQMRSNYESSKSGLETKLEKEKITLHKAKHAYNISYHTYMQEEGDDSALFLATLARYRDTELPSYREKIANARREAEQQFRDHFVSRLNEYLTDARESFNELNHTLKDIRFGQDEYRFSMEVHPEKKLRLEAIREAAQVPDLSDTIFAQLSTDDQKRSIEELFDSILRNDLQSEEVRELCDYRKYFHYDIIIRHTETIDEKTLRPLESPLSRVLREKSGGETQTPYYVAIAASFYRFYKDEKHAVRLVLFDEAFNKMDDDRIGKMIDFFKKLEMQVVTAVPTEKIEMIAPYMDRINLVIRHNYRAFIRDYALLADVDSSSASAVSGQG